MRDILLSLVFFGLVLAFFKNPAISAYLWAWVSIFNPHTLTFGFARTIPWAATAAVLMMLALLVKGARKPLPLNGVTVTYLLLLLWMSLTSLTTINPADAVLDRWIFVMKIHLMMIVTFMLLRGRQQIQTLVWVVAGSVAFYGIKGGAWTLWQGGSGRVWGPPGGMIAGNNELAVALVMLLPIVYYLYLTTAHRWARLGIAISIALMAFSILGTQSRGALLAMLAMALALGLKGKHPVRASLGIMMFVGIAIAFMPDSWTSRMETIGSYQTDGSAMSRVYTWETLWALAMDRPILGAGFGTDTLVIFNRYGPIAPEFEVFRGQVYVAHSIYFQALGEHGFPGLLLYLAMGVMAWNSAGRLAKEAQIDPEFRDWAPLLARMVQVSLLGFAVGGAFLSLMHLDVVYYVVGFVVLTQATLRETQAARAPVVRPATA